MSSQPATSSGTLREVISIKGSIQRKLAIWTILLVVVPAFFCALWLSNIAGSTMRRNLARHVTVVGQTLASSLAGRITNGWTPAVGNVLNGLVMDSRLAFVMVTDPAGQPWQRRVADPEAWTHYERWMRGVGLNRGSPKLEGPITLGPQDDLIVGKLPIWNPPTRRHVAGQAKDEPRRLEGFVIVALRDSGLPRTIEQLRASHWLATTVICGLTVPIVILAVRRWTAPLRSLLDATVRLGAGEDAPKIAVDSRNELGRLAESFNDMATNLVQARQELERANEDLEWQVSPRTEQLQHVNRRLESEIEDKNQFFRTVTHDLRAPLRNISGLAAMLLMKYRRELSDEALKKLERIKANVQVESDLINDLLELSRLRHRTGQSEVVDLQQLVERLAENLSYDLERGDIRFEIHRPLPTIHAESNRIRQVFQNLMDNAVKYMGNGDTRLVTCDYQERERYLEFSVQDTGVGIPASDLPNVFDVFRRGRNAAEHSESGRGLGLASVKLILESYGGRIWVESEPGIGSTFFFNLDLELVQAPSRTACPVNASA